MRTSCALGGATSTSSMLSGAPASHATAALHVIVCGGNQLLIELRSHVWPRPRPGLGPGPGPGPGLYASLPRRLRLPFASWKKKGGGGACCLSRRGATPHTQPRLSLNLSPAPSLTFPAVEAIVSNQFARWTFYPKRINRSRQHRTGDEKMGDGRMERWRMEKQELGLGAGTETGAAAAELEKEETKSLEGIRPPGNDFPFVARANFPPPPSRAASLSFFVFVRPPIYSYQGQSHVPPAPPSTSLGTE